MKLRVKGNSLRFRLTRSEVARLGAGELVEESTRFAPDQVLRYGVQAGSGCVEIQASFQAGAVRVAIPVQLVRQWESSAETGIYGSAGDLDVIIEKDFRCLTRPEERLDPDIFPHPGADTKECGGGSDR